MQGADMKDAREIQGAHSRSQRPHTHWHTDKAALNYCMPSLRRNHANLLCMVPIFGIHSEVEASKKA
eukprot:1158991-Pelagomonas_calceolata.AAC.10